MKKVSMFENYPDVVEVEDLRKMLGGISRKSNTCWVRKCAISICGNMFLSVGIWELPATKA